MTHSPSIEPTDTASGPKPRCRCYINAKHYARVASSGKGTMKGYKPCPIHESDALPVDSIQIQESKGETNV